MKNGPVVVFRVLSAMLLALSLLMFALHFMNDGQPHILSAVGPFIMSIAIS